MALFELTCVGGPWAKRLARRRAAVEQLPWNEGSVGIAPSALSAARLLWTQSAFSEIASAAAFAEIASSLLSCGAPIDLVAAAGDFVVDEVFHAELSARLAMTFGGAVALDVDWTKLVRPPSPDVPLRMAAERIVRTSCVGEALTVPMLKTAKKAAGSALVEGVIDRIVRDESAHAELGFWFLDWAAPLFSDADREHLGRAAGHAIFSFAPLLSTSCDGAASLGALNCAAFDPAFEKAVRLRVVRPLAARGIVISEDDLPFRKAA